MLAAHVTYPQFKVLLGALGGSNLMFWRLQGASVYGSGRGVESYKTFLPTCLIILRKSVEVPGGGPGVKTDGVPMAIRCDLARRN